jgi:hypothetical protein
VARGRMANGGQGDACSKSERSVMWCFCTWQCIMQILPKRQKILNT